MRHPRNLAAHCQERIIGVRLVLLGNDADEFGDHRAIQLSMKYAKQRIIMRFATPAIRQIRATLAHTTA